MRCAVKDGVKYDAVDVSSLMVHDVQLSDNGTYECRAEVKSQATLKLRHVHLSVLCWFTLIFRCITVRSIATGMSVCCLYVCLFVCSFAYLKNHTS